MIVIIEGLDGVGKTTIAKQIAEQYHFQYTKESYTNSSRKKELRMMLMLARLTNKEAHIYDRTTLIDDFVYDFLNETKSSLTQYFDIIIAILSKCKIVHLELDEQLRQQRFNERGDQYITNDDIQKIDQQYNQFYSHLTNVKRVKLTGDLDQDVKKVMEVIND